MSRRFDYEDTADEREHTEENIRTGKEWKKSGFRILIDRLEKIILDSPVPGAAIFILIGVCCALFLSLSFLRNLEFR